MSPRLRRWALLLALAMLLSGCAATPPDSLMRGGGEDENLISADTRNLPPDHQGAVLYFRYGNSAYLAAEERQVPVERNESPEKALVQALIDGPAATASALSPLFPPGTEVLAAVTQGDTLFITFSEAFLGRYSDEPGDISSEPWKTEAPLRRRLCLDALAATLTEAGLCARVQVLVYRGAGQSTTMRLQAGYLDRSRDDSLLPPVTRNESSILTPHNTASAILTSWMTQEWAALYDWTARDASAGRPGEQSAVDAFASALTLTGFTLSPGSVSPDGQSAVVGADLSFRGDGQDITFTGYPLRLVREDGVWRMMYAQLIRMMKQE